MIRIGLKITPKILSDKDIEALIKAIDDDSGGELDLDGTCQYTSSCSC